MDDILCPNCGKPVKIDQALRHQLEEKISQEQAEKHKIELEKAREEAKSTAEKAIKEKTQKELEESEIVNKKLHEDLMILKKQQEESEAKRKEQEEKIKEQAYKEASDKGRLEKLEFEKKISDMQKALEDAQRRGKQGSQQLQGEVLELDLETKLKGAFIYDDIQAVGKGKEGGDIIQKVNNKFGKTASIIIWEFKRTKAWNKNWLTKLREDARVSNASESVIVTEVMPDDLKDVYGKIDGVWVTTAKYALPLASILREMGLRIAGAKAGAQHDDESLKKIHDYILSDKFKQRIEKDVETVNSSLKILEDKHRSDEKYYRSQKSYMEALSDNTSQIYFDLQNIIPALPSVAGIEGELADEDEESNIPLL